jgi:hypothetical protein
MYAFFKDVQARQQTDTVHIPNLYFNSTPHLNQAANANLLPIGYGHLFGPNDMGTDVLQ